MKDIRCVFGCHIYSQAEAKVVDERGGYLLARVNMFCTRCGKPYEDIIAIPFPEWLQRKPAQPETIKCKNCKHFNYDMVLKREVCDFWDDFCSRVERRTDE